MNAEQPNERCIHKNVELEAIPGADDHVLHCKDCDVRLKFCEDCAFRVAAQRLGSCAVFTLGNYKHLGRGSGLMFNRSTGQTVGPWQTKFFDSLDLIGYEIDREAYFKPKTKRKKADAKGHAHTRGKESGARSSRRSRPTGRARARSR